jgi:asparagine synthase (glutamine-hydrolysing)
MSGWIGIVQRDGGPVDRDMLWRMTQSMANRGPDAQHIEVCGAAGLGHAMLRTHEQRDHARQPLSMDGKIWIAGHIRLDARRELIRELEAREPSPLQDASDAELILRAYIEWGGACVEHIFGEFSFAIWDEPRQTLFCARDQMGVRPFFYAYVGDLLLTGNTLDCLRMHPAVSDNLNDLAIADFLLFGVQMDPTASAFADIHRLPAAHCLKWTPDGLKIRRYWTLPIEEPVRHRRNRDYLDHFRELLDEAVAERMPSGSLGIYMSGGIDSSTLAATACRLKDERSLARDVRAYTYVYDRLIPDQERHYADLVAKALGIPIHFFALDDCMLTPGEDDPAFRRPEPGLLPFNRGELERLHLIASQCRVALFGEGPDNAFVYEWQPYLRYLRKTGQIGRLAADLWAYAVTHRRIPLVGRLLRDAFERTSEDEGAPQYPHWLNPDFAVRLNLRARWEAPDQQPTVCHPTHPKAYESFTGPLWQGLFESRDAGITKVPLEVRHPYVDLRLLRYMLRVPAIPYCFEKHLMRENLRGAVPEEVRKRRKAPLAGDPAAARTVVAECSPFQPVDALAKYFDFRKLELRPGNSPCQTEADLRLIGLNYWLRNLTAGKENNSKETTHELVVQ